jgi:hypothetical protein
MTPINVDAGLFTGYKYLLCLALITLLHSFFSFSFRVYLSCFLLTNNERHERQQACSFIPSPSGDPTPPPTPSGSPPLLGSPLEVPSCSPHSSVFEQGGFSGKAPVVDLSFSVDEEGLVPNTSCDEEFAQKLFGDLNRDVLEPPDDSNIIILSNSDEE